MTFKKVNQLASGFMAAVFVALAVIPLTAANVSAQEPGGGGLRVPPGPISLEIYPGETIPAFFFYSANSNWLRKVARKPCKKRTGLR